ncbi:sensor histidine kinase [Roseivivax isoporae]|uniref:histidine kinase n=1 Tax=Roseivivax isoporae LMG 25204 TaxID=1449351 RepID=X7F533_9RHOB|nr:ATP-binding protein [Roseivivax isoporae]ETX27853.1 hypothetical protein RISW2_11000 [Roseivivax isoporae LMG 25204]
MKVDPGHEIERLYGLEYSEKHELTVRFTGILLGNLLLVAYFEEPGLWAWSVAYLTVHFSYFMFLRRARRAARTAHLHVGTVLFLCIMVAYLWVPVFLVAQATIATVAMGLSLVGALLVYLVRRADTMPLMVLGQVTVVGIMGAVAMYEVLRAVDRPLEKLGIVVAGTAFMGYFALALYVSRQRRFEAHEAAVRGLQAQKLSAVGQLAGGVAHDFNNNLTAIMGNIELALVVSDAAERDNCLHEALLASRQAAHTVRQLLLYARKEHPDLQVVAVTDLVGQLGALTRRLIPASVDTTFCPGAPGVRVRCDKSQVLTALINLVTNSIDAMESGGRIAVGTEVIEVTKPAGLCDGGQIGTGPFVAISVSDTGPGIPRDILDRIFEPFFTTKPVGKGTGLGLSMVSGVARSLGGGVDVTTSPEGTSVAIFLPVHVPPPGPAAPETPSGDRP